MLSLIGPIQKSPPKSDSDPPFKCKRMGFFHQIYNPNNVNDAEELHADILYLRLRI